MEYKEEFVKRFKELAGDDKPDNSDEILLKLNKLERKLKRETINSNQLAIKLATYMTILGTFISIPLGALVNASKSEKIRTYRTVKESILLIDEATLMEYPNKVIPFNPIPKKNANLAISEFANSRHNIISSTGYYDEVIYPENTIYVREYNPYTTSDKYSIRIVNTYQIDDKRIEDVLNSDAVHFMLANHEDTRLEDIFDNLYSLNKILANITPMVETEKVPASSLSLGAREYPKKYYEIVEFNQDLDDYKDKLPLNTKIELIVTLLANLFVYLLVLEINQEMLIISVINLIKRLIKNQKVCDKNKEKLAILMKQYGSIISPRKLNRALH